jgi:polyphenol oxidase
MLIRNARLPSTQNAAPSPVEIPFLEFSGLSRIDGLKHAIYTRHGGSSRPPYETLNVGATVGDNADHVAMNLQRIQQAFGAPRLQAMNQVHGDHVLLLRRTREANPNRGTLSADAMATSLTGIALMVKQADCQAVILAEPVKKAVAVVHCGWRGNTANLLAKVVERMKISMGCTPSEIRAAIGPSLGPCCGEFTSHETLFPAHFKRFMVRKNYFDLWEISRSQLLEAGLHDDKIEIAGICTRCRTDLFFSYRGEGTTGRFATLVMLEP